MRKDSGITLVALVVTIIILLILAAVTLVFVLGNDGIIEKAKEANKKTEEASIIEKIVVSYNLDHYDALNASPYQYQILGSYLVPEIERKLGRKLEATDRFYEVDNQYLGLTDTYLFNIENEILIKVDKTKLKRRKAMWYWIKKTDYITNEESRNMVLNQLKADGITDLYVSYDVEKLGTSIEYNDFIKDCYNYGIITEFLCGDIKYIAPYNHEEKVKYIDNIIKHNENSNYNEKIAGIHYDIEIYLAEDIYINQENTIKMDGWLESNTDVNLYNQRRTNYLILVKKAREYLDNRGKPITLAFDMVPWISAYDVMMDGKRINLMDELCKNTDYLPLMDYRDKDHDLYNSVAYPTGVEYSRSSNTLNKGTYKKFEDNSLKNYITLYEICNKYKKVAMIGVEVSNIGDKNSFYEEGKAVMKQQLQNVEKLLTDSSYDSEYNLKQQGKALLGIEINNFDRFGFIYHHLREYVTMTP